MEEENESTNKKEVELEGDDELTYLRQQNSELKGLVLKALKTKLTFDDLPSELRDDRDFIVTGVRCCSVDWYTLPQKWKDNSEVACEVFKRVCKNISRKISETARLLSIDGENNVKWIDLPYHLLMDKEVLLHALRAENGPKWKEIPHQFKSEVDLLSVAVQYGKIPFEDVPEDLKRNHKEIALYGIQYHDFQADECPCFDTPFLRQKIEEGELDWNELPIALRNDINFARSISKLTDKGLTGDMLHNIPELRPDRSFWLKLRQAVKSSTFRRLMERFAPTELYADHDYMLEMCQECPDVFSLVDESLANDRIFFESVVNANPHALKFISHELQLLHRDLVINAVSNLRLYNNERRRMSRDTRDIARCIYPAFWSDQDFAMVWIKAGLDIPHHLFTRDESDAWLANREVRLANAIHCIRGSRLLVGFEDDVDFVREVVEHRPELYLEASPDPKAMMTAFAGSPKVVMKLFLKLHLAGDDVTIHRILTRLRESLSPFETFSSCILSNMLSSQSVEETGTNLTLLNQGLETSMIYKKVLAEYLDIPTGKVLRRLQQAERNIVEAIAPWAPNA